jgi:hypothetical protein
MKKVVYRFKSVGFIVIKEHTPTIGDAPEPMRCILITSSGFVNGIVPVLRCILMGGISARSHHIATETDDALALSSYPDTV